MSSNHPVTALDLVRAKRKALERARPDFPPAGRRVADASIADCRRVEAFLVDMRPGSPAELDAELRRLALQLHLRSWGDLKGGTDPRELSIGVPAPAGAWRRSTSTHLATLTVTLKPSHTSPSARVWAVETRVRTHASVGLQALDDLVDAHGRLCAVVDAVDRLGGRIEQRLGRTLKRRSSDLREAS